MRRQHKKKTNDALDETSLVSTHNVNTYLVASIQFVNSIAKVCFIVCVRRASLLLRFSSSLINFMRLGHNEETRAKTHSQS